MVAKMKESIYTIFIAVIITISLSQNLFGETNNIGASPTFGNIPIKISNNENPISDFNLLSTESWEQIPGPYGGLIQCMTNHNNVIYSGTIGGGVYKSTDFGDHWIFIGGDLPFFSIEKILYYNGRIIVSNKEYGIYYTDNDGQTWMPLNNGLKNIQITSIVELDGTLFCSSYGDGIYSSTNSGDNWIEKNTGLPNKYVNQMTLYRSALYLATNQGIYLSGNYGESWGTIRTSGSFMHIALNEPYIFIASNYQILMTSNNGLEWDVANSNSLGSGTVYSLYSTGPYIMAGRSTGVFVSTFIGGEWVNVHSQLKTIRVYTLMNLNNLIYAGTSKGVFYSNDFGGNWRESNNGLLNERIISIMIDNKVMYAGLQDNGVIKSTDFGMTWTDLNLGYRRVSFISKDAIGLWVISNDTLISTSNNGITWEYRNYGLEGNKLHFLAKFNNEYYVGTDDGLYFSTNSGMSWLVKTHELRNKKIRDLFVDKNNYVYLATDDKIYLSRDVMKTWITSSDGMKSYNITRITGNEDYILAGSQPDPQFDAEIYVSYDEARTWISSDFKFTDQYIHDIIISGITSFVTIKNTGVGESMGVLCSSNSGKSWHEFNEGLTVKDIRDLAIDNNTIYAGSYGQSLVKREIPEPLATPVLLYPDNASKNIYLQAVLDWESIDGADIYNIEIGDNYNNFDKNIIAEYSSTISNLQIPDKLLEFNTQYYWRVNFIKDNRVSDWSEIFSFTTEGEQVTITNLIAPDNNSSDISVLTEFEWAALENVSEYTLQISETETFDSIFYEISISQNNYTIPKGKLDFEKHYFWRVKAVINGFERDWSEIFNFTTLTLNLIPPAMVHPLEDAEDIPLTIFFEWESVTNADEYIIYIATDTEFSEMVYSDTVNSTIINMSEGVLNWETEYYWKVKAKFLNYESEWSSVRKFTTTIEVSVEDELLLSQCDFYMRPNPADKEVNINISLPFKDTPSIYIIDSKGCKIYDKVLNYENSNINIIVPLKNVASGNYFVVLKTKKGIITRNLKILK